MKRILIIFFVVIVILSSCNASNGQNNDNQIENGNINDSKNNQNSHQDAPYIIVVYGEDELSLMRKMIEADEEELFNYLDRMHHSVNGMTSREDVVSFLELLDSLPIPYISETWLSCIDYYPESETKFFDVFFRNEIGEIYSFRFFTAGDRGKAMIEENISRDVRGQYIELFQSRDSKSQIKVFSPSDEWVSFSNERGILYFPMEIDGYFVRAIYNPGDSGKISDVTPEEIYRDIVVTSFKDDVWLSDSIARSDERTVRDSLGE